MDARGRACPVPILELARAARASRPGEELALVATDPAVERDLRAWCEATGNELVGLGWEDGVCRAKVRVRILR